MTPEEKKRLFAAYLNMARQNAFITLSHISKLTGGNVGSEGNLSQMSPIRLLTDKKAFPETVEKVIKLLNEHFPFLRPMLDKELRQHEPMNKPEKAVLLATPEMYQKILTTIFSELNKQRNQYTHVQHEAEPFDRELISYMKNCFDGAVRVVKERFSLPDKDVMHLYRFKKKLEVAHGEKRKYEENPEFPYKFDDNKGEITDKGLAFFTCLFLEREYANLLLSQIRGFRRNGQKGVEESTRATKTVFNIYNIRLPKLRINSESSTMTLGIDMLNELKKCPAELFEHLYPETQERFRINPDETQSNDDDTGNIILLKRFENRFPQLALSYIDRQKLFSNVRFQMALGTYRYKFYDKQGVDQKERVRILQKKLHGFGRLQEIEERRKQEWEDKIRPFEDTEKDHTGTEPYITDTHAQYMISNNRVGMYWNTKQGDDIGNCLPTLKEDGVENQAPACWLSIYELPAMIFHSLLCSKEHATQNIIRNYVWQCIKLFSAIQTGNLLPSPDIIQIVKDSYKIDFLQLPDKIRDYLSGKAKDMEREFVKLTEARIERMIKSTQGRRRKIENDVAIIQDNKKNKVGKKRYVEIKSGVLADFLSEDLLLFQPTQAEGKDKLTGINYQALQAALAYYSVYKAEMKQILTACKLLDSPVAHPFLDKVMKKTHNDIVSFYQSYLDEREKYLNKCLQEKNYRHYHFLHANRDKWQQRNPEYYKQLAGKYLKLPIELPRGLFNTAIQTLLSEQCEHCPEMKKALSQERCNTVYLIQTYFKTILDDGRQEFYDFPRSYKLFDMLNEEKNAQAIQIHNKLTHLRNDFEKNEKTLRLTQVQDMLLFLMAKKLLIDNQSRDISKATMERYKLKHIKPDSETDILSMPTFFSLPVTLNGIRKIIRQEALKLKKFGDFYRLVRDRRVETLLPHLPDETIDRLTLEKELKGYDSVRIEIFGLIHRFERQVIEKKNIQTLSPDFVDILRQCPEIDRETKQQMQIIRNAFSHNSYPGKKEHIRDVESNDAKAETEAAFRLDGTMPNVAIELKNRLEKLVEDSLTKLK